MRRIGRIVAGPIAAAALLAGVMLGLAPSRAVNVPVLPSIDLSSPLPTLPLPTLDLGSPLPTLDLGSPLPTLDLGSPLPTLDLGSPLPTLPLPSPLPTVDAGTPPPSPSVNVSPPASSDAPNPEPNATADGDDPGSALGAPGASGSGSVPAGGRADEGLGDPAIVELPPPAAAVPDIGTFLIPAMGVTVPVLIAVAILALQVLGGAAGLRLAQRTLERLASIAPRWTRT